MTGARVAVRNGIRIADRSGLIAVCFALSACVSATAPAPTEVIRTSIPELGVEVVKEVGEPLFETVIAKRYDGISFPPGARYRERLHVWEPDGPFLRSPQPDGTVRYCGTVTHVQNPLGGSIGKVPGVCFTEAQITGYGLTYERVKVTRVDPANVRRQLLYQGKVGQELRLSYREFVGDMARPAFTQDLTFDLGEGRTVGAKGARIEVIDASNVSIRYRVTSPFNE
jgi:hypothetical protein